MSEADAEAEIEELEFEEENHQEILANMMGNIDLGGGRNAGKKKKKELVYQGGAEYIMYQFEDHENVSMVSIEMHLPSGATEEEYRVELVTDKRGRSQVVRIKHDVNRIFLSNQAFLKNHNQTKANVMYRAQGRKKYIKGLRLKYCDAHDSEKMSIISHTNIKLPFVCDDIFDQEVVAYDGTGIEFTRFSWNDGMNYNNVCKMELVLVKKDRHRANMNTPQRVVDITLTEANLEDLYD